MPSAHNPKAAYTPKRLPPPAPLGGRPYRVAAVLPRYLPEHNAGAETMAHALLTSLAGFGWDVRVSAIEHRGRPYRWDGVMVESGLDDSATGGVVEWADVVVTHLHGTRRAVAWCRQGRPLVHLVHNHTQLTNQRVRDRRDAALVVWNSEWVAREWAHWAGPSIVVRPPTVPARYATEAPDRYANGYVTLLNLTEVKGGKTFWRLAQERPDLPFLGVVGAYYLQELPDPLPPNARVLDNDPDVLRVYGQTRVLLMPSHYESWGQTAVEAMASGIPVVASDTPGLRECLTSPTLGTCGLLVDMHDFDGWRAALRSLDDPTMWAAVSALARARSIELEEQARADTRLFANCMGALAEGRSVERFTKEAAHD